MRFKGRTVLVTGAGSGIGKACAELIASEGGAGLVLVDADARGLDKLRLDCPAIRLAGDVADEGFWASAELGALDHAVINAGVAGAGLIAELDLAEWRRILSVNLDGAFLTLRAVLRTMREGGSIVAVASAAGLKPEPGIAAYGASKAGLIHLARIAAKETASRRIRINAIAPGGVETPVWDAVPMFAERAREIGREAAFAELAAMATPLGRYATAQEIAGQIAFLLSDEAGTITGSVLVSDGGYTL
ncbi:MAG TPA: SDR family oxidoreductase [Sphingomicrobium sp.]|nr:SDR family oxidoreductase [Sphingomicrobium sp.]